MSAVRWPIPAGAIGLATAGTVLWRYRGRTQVTSVVKATFSLVAGDVMTRVTPDPLYPVDVHEGDDPTRSLRELGDLVPYRAKADVLVTGSAYAPEGSVGVTARLALERATRVIDKAVQVIGDHVHRSTLAEPFARIPLVYERAFGGPSWDDNPIGTGMTAGSTPPNLLDPRHRQRTIGLGPIPRAWPARARLLASTDRRAVDAPVPEIPSDLDWAYFQAAPPDQRTEFLRGDERIVLEHLHPSLQQLRTEIPQARAVGRMFGLDGPQTGRALVFNADLLHIDTDRACCSITWRSVRPLPEGVDIDRLSMIAGVETTGRPVVLPSAPPAGSPLLELTAAPSGPVPGPTLPVVSKPAAPASLDQTVTLTGPPTSTMLPHGRQGSPPGDPG